MSRRRISARKDVKKSGSWIQSGTAAAALAVLIAICAAALSPRSAAFGQESGASPEASATPQIQFPNIPRLTLQVVPGYGAAPLEVGFFVNNANPDSAPFVSYRFSFGDGQISTMPPTVLYHTYTNPGTYTVTVTAETSDGQAASAIAGVTVVAVPQ